MITIVIDTDNASFQDNKEHPGREVGRILQQVADKFNWHAHVFGALEPTSVRLYDLNGVKVGSVTITD